MSNSAHNPLLSESTLPYQMPDFTAIRVEHLAPALREGLAEQRAEWEAIATEDRPASVETVLVPLEKAGRTLSRTLSVFWSQLSSIGGPELEAIEEEFAPLLSEHFDTFYLDGRIYQRLQAIDTDELDESTAWLLETYLKRFRRAGVGLGEAEQERLRELNSRQASLQAAFSKRVVAALNAHAPTFSAEALAGVSAEDLAGMRQNDGYRVDLQSTTQQPLAAHIRDADTRARLYEASVTRNWSGDADTRQLVLDLARVRAERAQLLGYAHHADYVAEDAAAGTSAAIMERLRAMAAPAARNAKAESAELAELMAREDPRPFAISDWSYYSEKLRQEKFNLSDAALKPYLRLENVIEKGVFFAAQKLYGLSFTRREDIVGHTPDAQVWEVFNEAGEGIGLFSADYFTREGKHGGAWMASLADQSELFNQHAIVTNDLNIPKPAEGAPALLTWDDVRTCFHEFGHALHGLLSQVRWPSQSGTSVPRDFVEYPSQLNEMWMTNPIVLRNYARHYQTGEEIPADYVDTLTSMGAYGEGFATSEYLAAALLDQAWHRLRPTEVPSSVEEVERFEAEQLAALGANVVPPRYRSTYFNHTFGGGYDAGYYSYVWAEVLDADTANWFRTEASRDGDGGLNREAGQHLADEVLSRGYSRDPGESFRAFRGRDPQVTALMERRGLA
ncbi:MAG: M3 family metallopeptidase [Bowdeniella nasicola]|nr:M3 family metallopeptidase [Bowdeniella nasicola]